ncbi:MAG: HAD family hydrolase [Gammaproteobacteria bacterium]|jgi:predicted HAD superfamily phosphohydrolase YqeG|nr:HAD family hydrolase [Gammaproteobacteria bacterium]
MRWFFAMKNAWLQRKNLKRFMTDPGKQIHSLEEITAQRLDKANIAILVLDFDGVLAAHDSMEPSQEAQAWLKKLCLEIGETRIAIFSNKPKSGRITYFSKNFPSILMLYGVRKKPYPDGLMDIAEYKGVTPDRVMLLDDRLLTGMLATCLAYTQGWYFRPPKTDYCRRPIRETFFSFLRVFERGLVRVIG